MILQGHSRRTNLAVARVLITVPMDVIIDDGPGSGQTGTVFRLPHEKTVTLQHAIIVRHQPAVDSRSQTTSANAGEHALFMVRKSVKERGDEHVARHAADGIEVELHLYRL
jgi:hypothetical protein